MPINQNIKIEKKEKQEFPPLPKNIYQVELLDISAERRPTFDTRNKPEDEQEYETVLSFQFTLLTGKDEEDESLRGRNVWENFVPTFLYVGKNGKNKLYKITEALLGRQLTLEDEAYMDGEFLNSLIGKQCRVGTDHKTNGDKTFDIIESYYAVEQEMTPLTDEEKDKASVKKKQEEQVNEDYDSINQDTVPQENTIEYPNEDDLKDVAY